MKFNCATIADMLQQPPRKNWEQVTVNRFVIDSRQVQSGDCFIALRGERVDGHDYVQAAFDQGACLAIVMDEFDGSSSPVIRVSNARQVLAILAKEVRAEYSGTVICITGSNGKTTTKEILREMLARRFRVGANPGNLNSTIGVPLALLNGLDVSQDFWIQEAGISDFGELTTICNILRPEIGSVVNIGAAHLEKFCDLEGVLRAKGELLDWLSENGGRIALNTGDVMLRTRADDFPQCLCYSLDGNLQVDDLQLRWLGLGSDACAQLELNGQQFKLTVPGRAYAECWFAAAALAMLAGAKGQDLRECAAFDSGSSVPGRMKVFSCRGITVLDDSYNANPASLQAAFDTLAAMSVPGRRIAVVGHMAELGRAENQLHYQLGCHAAAIGLDVLLAIGAEQTLVELIRGFRETGAGQAVSLEDVDAAIVELHTLRSGDSLLIKGSRRAGLERLVKELPCCA